MTRDCDWGDITAIVPAYRCARYLPAAIQSLLSCPLNIVIADDCSCDETLGVAQAWREKFPLRIQVLQGATNVGAAGNINRALGAVRTTFVTKLDGDDIVFSDYLRKAYEVMWRNEDLAMICGDSCPIGPGDYLSLTSQPLPPKGPGPGRVSVMSGAEACRFVLRWDPYPCSSGAIYRTQFLKDIGGFREGMTWAEDREVWFRLARRWPVAFFDGPAAFYRRHAESATVLHRSQNRAAVADSRLILESRRHWPEAELLPDYARTLFRVARDCRRSAAQAFRTGQHFRAIECGVAFANTTVHALMCRMRAATSEQSLATLSVRRRFASHPQTRASDPGAAGDA